ncbi:hypothetical protein CB0940_03188 [Cercospora beticola]|uniref:F-box domain-containing protein n=1 Tax=Cercospora beticola TaxID=122368 RepID=A0A2G5I3H8_CERBT|nr:hypothetical protein CB0940_03188 [Cercospora beticola]PIA99357.1 hypothetical protein CB0940_03188 [Cercospora beticola]WPB00360.1 hypothetical protein RHO25_004979 [Cercospora beticola]CAK1361435.1 unnamed protein product [Cercospora beticola]
MSLLVLPGGRVQGYDENGRKTCSFDLRAIAKGIQRGQRRFKTVNSQPLEFSDLPPEVHVEIASLLAIEADPISLKLYHPKSQPRRLVRDTFKPASKGPSDDEAGEGETQMSPHSDASSLMQVNKYFYHTVKAVLYGSNRFDFHSSESVRMLKSLGKIGPSALVFLKHASVILEGSKKAKCMVADLSASPMLRSLVIVHQRINKCIFSKGTYSVSRLAQDIMPLIDKLHASHRLTPRSYKLQDIVSLQECHCKTCKNTIEGKACCALPACATAHTDFDRELRQLIVQKYGPDA